MRIWILRKDEVCLIVVKEIFYEVWSHVFFPIGFTLQDNYRICSYRLCSYELNNMCRKFSIGFKSYTILWNSYELKEPLCFIIRGFWHVSLLFIYKVLKFVHSGCGIPNSHEDPTWPKGLSIGLGPNNLYSFTRQPYLSGARVHRLQRQFWLGLLWESLAHH
jgi:hypothetical protein